jgi:hypothetical protein
MLCTTPFIEQCKLALNRIERGVGGPGAQMSKRASTLESLKNKNPYLRLPNKSKRLRCAK